MSNGTDCSQAAARAATVAHFRADSVDNSAWDGPAAMSGCTNSDTPASCFAAICAGKKTGDTSTQAAWALPHHKSPGSPPNQAGVTSALSYLSQTQGLTNAAAAKAHLQAHAKAINPDYEATSSPVGLIRSAGVRQNSGLRIPNGRPRSQPFAGQVRAKTISKGGHDFLHVEGYASVFDLEYDMYDMFGIYWESVDPGAFTKSLERGDDLDVAFLVNHRGVTMARTKNGTLRVYADATGLGVEADLRMDRTDVSDLASAIDSGLIDEMSFAFMLNAGEWDEEYMHFQITEADIDRGDVSAVNYGANPYTSIASRATEILHELDALPAGAARAAVERLNARPDMGGVLLTAERAVPGRVVSTAALRGYGPDPDGQGRVVSARGHASRQDADDTTAGLVAAVDAAIDQAMALVAGVDLGSLPPEVAQAIQLLGAADAASDELMDALNIPDPDEAGESELSIGMPTHTPGLGHPATLGSGHGAFTGNHSHEHPAYGSQGGDLTHDHPHDHAGDGAHTHSHGKADGAHEQRAPGQSMSVALLTAMHEADNATDADDDADAFGR